jgi:hypothetical protein
MAKQLLAEANPAKVQMAILDDEFEPPSVASLYNP